MKFNFILFTLCITVNIFSVDWRKKKSSVTNIVNTIDNKNSESDENEKKTDEKNKKKKHNEEEFVLEHLSEQDKQKIQEIINQSVKKRKKMQEQAEENKKDQPTLKKIFRVMSQKLGVEDLVDDYLDYWGYQWSQYGRLIKYGGGTLLGLWLLYKWRFKEDPLGNLLKVKIDEMIRESEVNGQTSDIGSVVGVNTLQKMAQNPASSEAVTKVLVDGLKNPATSQNALELIKDLIKHPEVRKSLHESSKGFSAWSWVRGRGCYPEYNK